MCAHHLLMFIVRRRPSFWSRFHLISHRPRPTTAMISTDSKTGAPVAAVAAGTTDHKEHHLPGKKGFRNPWPSFEARGLAAGLQTFVFDWDRKRCQVPEPSKRVPVRPLDMQALTNNQKLTATWLGHASFLIQIGGLNVLTDPVFSYRCSPSQWVGPARLVTTCPFTLVTFSHISLSYIYVHTHATHTPYMGI